MKYRKPNNDDIGRQIEVYAATALKLVNGQRKMINWKWVKIEFVGFSQNGHYIGVHYDSYIGTNNIGYKGIYTRARIPVVELV